MVLGKILVIFLGIIVAGKAANVTKTIYTGGTMNIDINDNFYPSTTVIPCEDFASPKDSIKTFSFNDGALPNNTETKNMEDKTLLYINYPTIENAGYYDCCVKSSNASSTDEACYRTTVTVTESAHYVVEDTVAVSLKRNNFLAVFPNNPNAKISCTLNGSTVQPNVQAQNMTTSPYYLIFNQLIILDTTASNLGIYTCNGIDTNVPMLTKNFTITEAATRVYPWGDENGQNSTDNNNHNDDNNSAGRISLLMITVLSLILSFMVL